MKLLSNKVSLILEQVIFLGLINYLLLIQEGFIFKDYWLPTFCVSLAYFHLGIFIALYYTLKSKTISIEQYNFLSDYLTFILFGFITFICYHNFHVSSSQLVLNYVLCLCALAFTVVFLYETYSSYKTFQ
jgi:thiamine transporter ThiT